MHTAMSFHTAFSNDAAVFAPSASCANCASSIVIIMDTVILAVSIFVFVLVLLAASIDLLVLVVLISLLLGSIPAKKQTHGSPPLLLCTGTAT